MQRLLMEDLVRWKQSARRKPLVLKGARRVGKTWLLKEFGRLHYERTVYFNFEEHEEYRQFFGETRDIPRLLASLSMAGGKKITPETTLILFDEIQACPDALNSLPAFCENAPEYHIACAWSLLGTTMSGEMSLPAGKVNFRELHPMTFTEFLLASGEENLASYLEQVQDLSPIPDSLFHPLSEKLKIYFITGGMPEAVAGWTEGQDPERVQESLTEILGAYGRDFARYPRMRDVQKIRLIWESLPSQLAGENKKFFYSAVKRGARAREYGDALKWLVDAGLVCQVFRSDSPAPLLSSRDDTSAFRLYPLDVGLLRRLSRLSPAAFAEGNRLFTECSGALSESYVLQALRPQFDVTPRYWSVDNPHREVDFLIQYEDRLIPVEVDAAARRESRSLKVFRDRYADRIRLRVCFSLQNLRLEEDFLNIPLFMADQTERLLGIALRG